MYAMPSSRFSTFCSDTKQFIRSVFISKVNRHEESRGGRMIGFRCEAISSSHCSVSPSDRPRDTEEFNTVLRFWEFYLFPLGATTQVQHLQVCLAPGKLYNT